MKKSLLCTISILLILVLVSCSSTKEKGTANEEHTFKYEAERKESAEDITANEVEEIVSNNFAEQEEYTPTEQLTEDEVLREYESYMESEDYGRAGSLLYFWLKNNDSELISENLEYIKQHIYASQCVITSYDEEDNVTGTSIHTYDNNGNLLLEQHNINTDYYDERSYQYGYDGDKMLSAITYDRDGHIVCMWITVTDADGNIIVETERYDNLAIEERLEHTYVNGLCVEEYLTSTDSTYGTTCYTTRYEYDEGLMVKETCYDDNDELYSIIQYEYDDNNNVKAVTYFDGNNSKYREIVYEYDILGNTTLELITEGAHEESYTCTYDKFGYLLTETVYMHEDVVATYKYERDFLGNTVIETSTEDGAELTHIYDYEYAFKE